MSKDTTRYTNLTIYRKTSNLLNELLEYRQANMTNDDFHKPNKASLINEIIEREHKRIFSAKK